MKFQAPTPVNSIVNDMLLKVSTCDKLFPIIVFVNVRKYREIELCVETNAGTRNISKTFRHQFYFQENWKNC